MMRKMGTMLLASLAGAGVASGQTVGPTIGQTMPTPVAPPVAVPFAPSPPSPISPSLIHPSLPPSPLSRLPSEAAGPAPLDQPTQAYRLDLLSRQRELEQRGVSPANEEYRAIQQQLNQPTAGR
jgi:hypothetical protein